MESNPETVIDLLSRAPGIIVPLVRGVAPKNLKRHPAPNKWSIHEHMCHLAVVHDLFQSRLDRMMKETAPVITPYDPAANDPPDRLIKMDLEKSIQSYLSDRTTLVARLRALSPNDWMRTAKHPQYRDYTVLVMFRHAALHDYFHGYRIEEMALNPEWA